MRVPKLKLALVLTFALAVGLAAFDGPTEILAQKQPGKSAARAAESAGSDWPEMRGPNRDGTSPEKNLPEKWSPAGENLLWTAPYGGIAGPVVHADHVYFYAQAGAGPTRQEHLICFDANTGKVLWKRAVNIYHSDVPPHRIAWASPAVDLETGNVYVFAANGQLIAFTRDGRPLWTRYVTEEFGLITTHGGRTVSPAIDGDMVIVSGVSFGWGAHAGGANRIFAFDKRTGELIWLARPGGRPTDTTYAPALIRDVQGVRLFINGLSDGGTHALKVNTGEVVWSLPVSKRGLNTGVISVGDDVIITHSEENLDTSEMGFVAAVNAASRGNLTLQQTRWFRYGFQGGYSSPVTDGKTIYQVDNGALLGAFDAADGKLLWTKKIGTVHKA
ncbi:MAG TPA: PQQ-binding-like beta-propeller repeat protein, partial [Candidatus Nitrosotenuis sp.]|nr:PQQ-binding-like beta-propeller repeat protein [Candidatus Nitrosotenuis sp.]